MPDNVKQHKMLPLPCHTVTVSSAFGAQCCPSAPQCCCRQFHPPPPAPSTLTDRVRHRNEVYARRTLRVCLRSAGLRTGCPSFVYLFSRKTRRSEHTKSQTPDLPTVYVVVRIDTGFGWMNGNYIGFSPSCFVSARHNGAATSCTSVRQRRVADDAPSFCLCLLVRTIYGRNRRVRILRIVGTHAND